MVDRNEIQVSHENLLVASGSDSTGSRLSTVLFDADAIDRAFLRTGGV
jgi:hypothetical protein